MFMFDVRRLTLSGNVECENELQSPYWFPTIAFKPHYFLY